ncbi:mismatch repair endonuclease PMS2 [Sitodiplosis mosellana]|uniref:mismatch repair endonuclease PMS2 n=1 Tax=Sitodiplosis mosellana TaxID=263140 RepID=UPI002444AB96|nr:mismatch repair endonuclease PMS2 [Sitodiplosis mosellana]XP_055311448.1 mismatch repair endonuclease PMS2 [Sitodiplosis mosellana]
MSSIDEPATTVAAKTISAINRDTVHKICSGQVVLSLAIAVKELVENALDAGATSVEVKVRENGLESIEVSDNGSGVEESNFKGLTAKYHTSKLREFDDLESVATFGFRGEALSSLCALSDMTITTKHHSVNVATKLELDHNGNIMKQTSCARHTGTTVTLTNLFASIPVRKREFQRNIQKEFVKMCQIMQAYGLISYGKRIVLINHTGKNGKSNIMTTHSSYLLRENIVAIFGSKQNANLLEIRPPIEQNEVLTQDVLKSLDASINVADEELDNLGLNRFQFDGYISSCGHGCGRSAKDRQFFFINGRPCDPKTIIKLVNDVYHRYNQHQYPFVVINVIMERRDVDVNVTPDKRQVMVNNETILRLALKKSLLKTFGNIPSTFKVENQTLPSLLAYKQNKSGNNRSAAAEESPSDASYINDDDSDITVYTEKGNASKFASMLSQWRATGRTDESCSQNTKKRKHESADEILARNLKMKKIHEYLSQDTVQTETNFVSYESEPDSDDDEPNTKSSFTKVNDSESGSDAVFKRSINDVMETDSFEDTEMLKNNNSFDAEMSPVAKPPERDYRIDCKVKAINTPNRMLKTYTPSKDIHALVKRFKMGQTDEGHTSSFTCQLEEASSSEAGKEIKPEIAEEEIFDDELDDETSGSQPKKIATISTSIAEIGAFMEKEIELEARASTASMLSRMKFKTKIDPKQNQSAENELKTEISKKDFVRMEIIGQFNLGFIIVKLDEDLFIVDQHATDEKYNFETLQKTTVLNHQPLVVPQDLDMTAVNEIIVMDNLKVFEDNGFRFDIDIGRPVTKRVKLIAKPFSRNWEFGKEDIDELVFMLHEGTSDATYLDTCRPSRVRAMFASRACRSSVMIGTSLSRTDMRRLIDHMGTIDQPWNCPHGRPTIRHLLNLEMLNITDDQDDNGNQSTSD